VGVEVGIEGGWTAPAGAFRTAAFDLIDPFRAGEGDPSGSQRGAGRRVGVGLVGQHPLRSFPGPPGTVTADRDLVEQADSADSSLVVAAR
jgi:hypothetical protein